MTIIILKAILCLQQYDTIEELLELEEELRVENKMILYKTTFGHVMFIDVCKLPGSSIFIRMCNIPRPYENTLQLLFSMNSLLKSIAGKFNEKLQFFHKISSEKLLNMDYFSIFVKKN